MVVAAVIQERLAELLEMVGGYDFARVVEAWWRGNDTEEDRLESDAVRWLRAESSTKTEAREALCVRTIVEDATIDAHLKRMARFVQLAGYEGLVACPDEMVNLYELANSRSRQANNERILSILNDSLRGEAVGLGFLFGGTPE